VLPSQAAEIRRDRSRAGARIRFSPPGVSFWLISAKTKEERRILKGATALSVVGGCAEFTLDHLVNCSDQAITKI
jgi:hypothetical protein